MTEINQIIDNKQENPIHVALSIYDPKGTYARHAGVVMTSIFENTKSPVCIYILHDETLTQDNRKKLLRTAEKYNQEIIFADVSSNRDKLSKKIKSFFYKMYSSVAVLYRLFVPEVIYVDKIIHMDCDIIVNLDINELWCTDVENFYMAAVRDEGMMKILKTKSNVCVYEKIRAIINNYRIQDYFNAGIMLMNLAKIRRNGNLLEQSLEFLKRHTHSTPLLDQDILNSIFSGHIKLLDSRFNKFAPKVKDTLPKSIIHGTTFSGYKLWEVTGKPAQYLYWQFYLKSAWGENIKTPEQAVELMLNASYVSPKKDKSNIVFRFFDWITFRYLKGVKGIFKILTYEFLYRVGLKK